MAYHVVPEMPKGSDPKLILWRNEFVKNLQGDMETMQNPVGAMVFGEKMGKLLDDVSNIKNTIECIEKTIKEDMATKDDIKKISDMLDKLDKK